MNKREMAATLAKKTDISQAKALEVLNCIFDTAPGHGIIAVELDAGRKVTIPGFGTFGTRKRAARTGTNPATGAKIQIAAKTHPYFKAGKTLKERVSDYCANGTEPKGIATIDIACETLRVAEYLVPVLQEQLK